MKSNRIKTKQSLFLKILENRDVHCCEKGGVPSPGPIFSQFHGVVSRKGVKFAYDNNFATHAFYTNHSIRD